MASTEAPCLTTTHRPSSLSVGKSDASGDALDKTLPNASDGLPANVDDLVVIIVMPSSILSPDVVLHNIATHEQYIVKQQFVYKLSPAQASILYSYDETKTKPYHQTLMNQWKNLSLNDKVTIALLKKPNAATDFQAFINLQNSTKKSKRILDPERVITQETDPSLSPDGHSAGAGKASRPTPTQSSSRKSTNDPCTPTKTSSSQRFPALVKNNSSNSATAAGNAKDDHAKKPIPTYLSPTTSATNKQRSKVITPTLSRSSSHSSLAQPPPLHNITPPTSEADLKGKPRQNDDRTPPPKSAKRLPRKGSGLPISATSETSNGDQQDVTSTKRSTTAKTPSCSLPRPQKESKAPTSRQPDTEPATQPAKRPATTRKSLIARLTQPTESSARKQAATASPVTSAAPATMKLERQRKHQPSNAAAAARTTGRKTLNATVLKGSARKVIAHTTEIPVQEEQSHVLLQNAIQQSTTVAEEKCVKGSPSAVDPVPLIDTSVIDLDQELISDVFDSAVPDSATTPQASRVRTILQRFV
ncbi:hypothetical protein DM01DRAFT_1384590 [Hesseltinella vesiculosa]|uniref:Uncharacterized protein n=1 Tax=Hesseltinella vesiculosa TaxID=101127 RepID=A0A1X2GDU4_9FUNG|nr:hypothetical protein DM01DRAFT_1384590 [Hesseltinella vesiculosa]